MDKIFYENLEDLINHWREFDE